MGSRPASPSQIRSYVDSMHSIPGIYNAHVVQESLAVDTQNSMGRSHNSLDIVLASDRLILRGTGVDVEPCTLRGNVVLNLVEATTFKEITMQFKGKSRVPQAQYDGSSMLGSGGGGYQTNLLYHHDWSFLEGELTHSPTLKAGRHIFPFKLQLEGHLPSSLYTHAGESAITYKLRATAVRPVFASNLHATAPVRILRSFAPEALEYQQTLELENTWPEKLMYSLMVPHKAWAAGDTIKTLAKFSPLVKGSHITDVTTSVQEDVRTFPKTGQSQNTTRVIATAKHKIRNGQAETTQVNRTSSRRPTPPLTAPNSPTLMGIHSPVPEGTFPLDPFPVSHSTTLVRTPLAEGSQGGMLGLSVGDSEQPRSPDSEDNLDIGEEEVVTTLPIFLPTYSTPSHSIEPIVVSHRIRWHVTITNLDGHLSELRCSLPLHVLDYCLLEDARLATRVTHRLFFGVDEAQPHALEELVLPSYPAHVLDRIANAYPLPSVVPTSNRLVARSDTEPSALSSASESTSSRASLLHAGPHDAPATRHESSGGVALDWVNSELHRFSRAWQRPMVNITTPPDSTQGSRHASRASSRASSPERGSGNARERPHHHHHHSIFSLKPFAKVASSLNPGQGKNHAPAADGAAHSPIPVALSSESAADAASGGSGSPSPVSPPGRSMELHMAALVDSTFSEVPDYDVASRGFLGGGVTPLSSTRGLPSYEEAERSGSEGDLAARFAAARSLT